MASLTLIAIDALPPDVVYSSPGTKIPQAYCVPEPDRENIEHIV